MANAVDTLKLSEELVAAGFEKDKARVLAEQFGELANEHLVTKEYLKSELEKMELRLTIKMAVIVTATLTFFKIIEGFFKG